MTTSDAVFRPLPKPGGLADPFWRSGADGVLRVQRCSACGLWVHPPQPVCRACLGRDLAFEPTAGAGAVYTYTVNEHSWNPTLPLPYVIALVELDEQRGLRLTSNIVGCDAADVSIGMRVRATFIEDSGVYLPVFGPMA